MTTYKPVEALMLMVSPSGAWRHNRFEFCNELEIALPAPDQTFTTERTEAAWIALAKMGVSPVADMSATRRVLDENGQERSSIVPGRA